MLSLLTHCELCPRKCGVNRINNEYGFCGASATLKVARASLHFWEEPCISGIKGSGTIFFSSCPLKCIFCQNQNISHEHFGKEISIERLSEIFIELQNQDAHNINLVTPTHYVPQIIEALKIAKSTGLNIPIVYNSSGYENVETIKLLNGYIDIYLPDMKYFDNTIALKYSSANNYFEFAKAGLDEMANQVDQAQFNDNGIMMRGVIVRHLVLPGCKEDSKKIIKYIYETYKNKVYISIMNQYTPMRNFEKYPELNNVLSAEDYDEVVDFALSIGVENGFTQEGGTTEESFIPEFDITGV